MKENKSNNIIIVLLSVIVLLLGWSLIIEKDDNKETNNKTEESTNKNEDSLEGLLEQAQAESKAVSSDEIKEYNEITLDEYMQYLKNDEKTLIIIGSPTCPYCEIADPIIKNVAYKYDLEINYLDTSKFSSEDETKFVKSATIFNEGYGTPTLFVVQNNLVNDSIEGLTTSDVYIEFLKNNGYIK